MALREEFESQGNWLFRYRSFLPISILIIGLALHLTIKYFSLESCFLKDPCHEMWYQIICLLVGFLGLFIRIYTVGYTPNNTSGRNTKEQLADSLNSTGIYSMVRHPLYLGNYFMWLALALLPGSFWFALCFSLAYWLYYERIMFAEEEFLRRKFGETYTNWAKGVPAFIPNFKLCKKPTLPFSWKKVLKKEKNGLAALFMLFCLFDISGKLIKNETNFNCILIIGFIVSFVLYLILKYLKSKTSVLDEKDR